MKGILVSLFLSFILTFEQVQADIQVDRSSAGRINSGTEVSRNHNTAAGDNRLMLVGVSLWNDDLETVTDVSYNGTALIKLGDAANSNDSRVEIWYLIAPPVGSGRVTVRFNENVQQGAGVGVMTFTGVDQANPLDTMQSAFAENRFPSLSVPTAPDDLVFTVMAAEEQSNNPSITSGTQRWRYRRGGNARLVGAGATLNATANATINWTLNNSDDWVMAGVSINPASGGRIPDPVLEYRMDEAEWQGTANEVTDSTGNNHDGTAQGGATTVENGAICRAGEFDGSNHYISAIDLSALRGTSSISYWVKTSQVGSSVDYLSPGISGIEQAGGTNDIFWGWINNSGRIGLSVGDNHTTVSSSSINNNTWRHVVLTRDASTGAYQIFIDGSLNASGTSTAGTISNSFSSIGRIEDTGGSPEYFQGQLDEILVFDQVLNSGQVSQIYNNQSQNPPLNWDGSSRNLSNCNQAPQQWEGGSLDMLVGSTRTINFSRTYQNPVLFLFTDNQSSDPNYARVVSVGSNSAQIKLVEPSNEDGVGSERVSFIVAERGRYELSGGAKLEVGVVSVSAVQHGNGVGGPQSWQTINFSDSFSSTPVLLTSLQSNNNGGDYISPWIYSASRNLNANQFQAALGRAEVNSGTVNSAESYAYLAVDSGALPDFYNAATGLVINAEAVQTSNSVTNACYTQALTQSYADNPVFVGAINTEDGSDGGWARGCGSTPTTVSLFIQEDNFKDTDGHTTEIVSFVAFDGNKQLTPVGEWRFDSPIWSGVDAVLDSSGNNYHGQAFSASSDASTKQICRAADLTATGTADYISLNGNVLANQGDFTISAWVKTAKTGSQALLSGADVGSMNELIMWFPNATTFQPHLNNAQVGNISIPSIADNQWHHLVWTRNSGSNCIYIDGNRAATCLTESNPQNITVEPDGLIVGQEQDLLGSGFVASQAWDGHIDELLIYDQALSQTQVDKIYDLQSRGKNLDGSDRGCAPSIDHFSISHDGTGVTCLLENVTISAHDSSHMAVDADGKTVNLSTTNGKGNWVGIVSGGSGLNNGAEDDGAASFTFAAGATSAVLTFAHPELSGDGESFGFNVTDGTISETSGNATASDDPNITFTLAGFRFIDGAGVETIPTQISGKASDAGFGAASLYLQAVEATTADPSVCQAAFPNDGIPKSINLAAQCNNPTSCVSGRKFYVKSGSNPEIDLNEGTPEIFKSVAMTFDAESKAPIRLNYNDAGEMQLQASYNVPDTGAVMTGNSNLFVVRPFGFGFPRISAAGGTNPGGDETGTDNSSGFAAADEPFDVEVNAYLYDAAEDTNNDGIPDAIDIDGNGLLETSGLDRIADLTDNQITPNFTGSVTLSADATFFTPNTGTGQLGNFSGGTATISLGAANGSAVGLKYDEVGSIQLKGSMSNYIQSGVDIGSEYRKVGRFYPDHFVLTESAVQEQCTPFTYMQQPFSALEYKIEARSADGELTENYDLALYSNTAVLKLSAENDDDGNELSSRLNMPASLSGWAEGVVDRTMLSSTAITDLTFRRQGGAAGLEDGPYTQLQLGMFISSELDNRNFTTSALNIDPDLAGDCTGSCKGVALGNATDLRYGRIRIQSAHAPETEDLPVPFTVEYWNGSAFVTNADDSCSVIPTGKIEFNSVATSTSLDVSYDENADTDTTGSFTDLSGGNVTASNGSFGLQFSAPGVGVEGNDNTGSFPVEVLNLDDWLTYDWNQDGSADDVNAQDAIITFGRTRGSDRMIFWQERYQ